MTGLDPARDRILEIAVLVTDNDLNALDGGVNVVVHQPPDVLALMGEVVSKMHHRSGLSSEVRKSKISLEEAGELTLDYIKKHVKDDKDHKEPLCGNSIGIDRRFLAVWLPEIEAYLHYHVVDVSSVKVLARRWYLDEAESQPKKKKGHRALDDVIESIEELRYWRETIFKPPSQNS